MNTFELHKKIQQFLAETDNESPFFQGLSELSFHADSMESHLIGISKGGAEQNQSATALHNLVRGTRNATIRIDQRRFFRALEKFRDGLADLEGIPLERVAPFSHLGSYVDAFAEFYNVYINDLSGPSAVNLLLSAQDLNTRISVAREMLQFVDETLEPDEPLDSADERLGIYLPSISDVNDFAQKLLAIQTLYSELCMLLSVSENSQPLQISKIESGSLWAVVFGDARVVALMTKFLGRSASWLFGRYSEEGQVASIPRKVEAVNQVLELKKSLEAAGVDTTAMNEHIQKSAVAISESLSTILTGQPNIAVNEKTYSVGQELERKFLKQIKQPSLPRPGAEPEGEAGS